MGSKASLSNTSRSGSEKGNEPSRVPRKAVRLWEKRNPFGRMNQKIPDSTSPQKPDVPTETMDKKRTIILPEKSKRTKEVFLGCKTKTSTRETQTRGRDWIFLCKQKRQPDCLPKTQIDILTGHHGRLENLENKTQHLPTNTVDERPEGDHESCTL